MRKRIRASVPGIDGKTGTIDIIQGLKKHLDSKSLPLPDIRLKSDKSELETPDDE